MASSLQRRLSIHGVLLAAVCALAAAEVQAQDAWQDQVKPLLTTYCLECHGNDGVTEGDVDLLAFNQEPVNNADLIQRLIDVIDLNEMPPSDAPQPAAKERGKLSQALHAGLRSALTQNSSYPATPLRRMNRFQYNNAVIDLFELKCVVFTLPERMMREHQNYFRPASGKMADVVSVGSRPLGKSQLIERRLAGVAPFPQDLRAENGFDNRGDHLSLSPMLMESFLKLGQSVVSSKDFERRNVGIWDKFFAAPKGPANQLAEVRPRLSWFLERAFRRPVEDDTLNRYSRFVSQQLEQGIKFEDAMRSVSAAVISSPRFLYLYDTQQAGPSSASDQFDLASRLSFFLWGSLPDEELLQLAIAGQLSDRATLLQQVDRMLSDRKLKRFCDSFPAQWLQLERIISATPDRKQYPGFYFSKYRDSMHMMMEPLLLFETVLIEDLPVTQFIDSDFTYRSKLLDEAYGELASGKVTTKARGGAVTVLRFQRVPVTDRRTGGLITNAAVMTMTSGTTRTKPITRGAWVASVVFNNPPEPPPADVPPLEEHPAANEANLTLRERLELHRKRSDCRGCHEKIDPLGFALENFDVVGSWRQNYENDRKIDVSGALFRRHEFSNVVEFKDAIMVEKDRFVRGLAGHLLSFALARELAAADQPVLDQIASASAQADYRMKSLIKQIVLSEPFQGNQNVSQVPQGGGPDNTTKGAE